MLSMPQSLIIGALSAALALSCKGQGAPSQHPGARAGSQVPLQDYKEDLTLLKVVRILQCQFDSGFATAVLADGSRTTVPMASLFGTITYDNINRSGGTAREISDVGGKNVVLIATDHALTFMEVTTFGNPIFTTVFPTLVDSMPGAFLAVTSRHITPDIMTPGAPRVLGLAQYYGRCNVPIAQ